MDRGSWSPIGAVHPEIIDESTGKIIFTPIFHGKTITLEKLLKTGLKFLFI